MAYQSAGATSTLANSLSPSTANVAIPSNVSGDFLLLVWMSNQGDSTLTGPAGWTGPVGISRTSQTQHELQCWYKVSSGSEGATAAVSSDGSATTANGGIATIYNYGQATFEASGTWDGSSTSTTITLASMTSGGTSRLIVDVYGPQGNGSGAVGPFTHPSGSSERVDSTYGIADQAFNASGSTGTRTATATTGTPWLQSVSLLLVDSSGPSATITSRAILLGAGH